MYIKFTREEYNRALIANTQYEYPMENDTLGKLRTVFSFPQTDYVYLSFDEYQQIIPIIPKSSRWR